EKGLGVIVVLHDVNMAARFCDEIVALHSGHLIARGTPKDIMTPETLERIYGVRMDVMTHAATGFPVALPL
ncbi:MAG: Fe3+-hydroxamate ABC transporter ATP-binding protein FhuC, partial [Rhizobium oryzihabitans]